jgi:DNA-binding HxlR family transcriptional regulator
LRALVATFGEGDEDKVLMAMRCLPYDRLVLVGEAGEEPSGLAALRRMESMAGNEAGFVQVGAGDFMGLVDELCELVTGLARPEGGRCDVVMNVSGGTKLLADAAMFAAFRLGVPAYHVTDRVVRLPVMKGVTARNRFTSLQAQFISRLGGPASIPELVEAMPPHNKQSLERVMRELTKMGLVSARLESMRVVVSLTEEGHEIRRALAASNVGGGRDHSMSSPPSSDICTAE